MHIMTTVDGYCGINFDRCGGGFRSAGVCVCVCGEFGFLVLNATHPGGFVVLSNCKINSAYS